MNSTSVTIELYPYRSLSRKGFMILMVFIALISFVAGMVFLMMGAWPIFGFFGLDVALIWWAIKRNYRDGDCSEVIRISQEEIVITRKRAKTPEASEILPRTWAKVRLDEDIERDLIGKLFLISRGKVCEIGGFLNPHDRKSLAKELRGLLAVRRL